MAPHIALLGRALAFSFAFTSRKNNESSSTTITSSSSLQAPYKNYPILTTATLRRRRSLTNARTALQSQSSSSHSTVVSPYSPSYYASTTTAQSQRQQLVTAATHSSDVTLLDMEDDDVSWGGRSNSDGNVQSKSQNNVDLSEVCKLLGATPTDLLRIGYDDEDGERGLYLNRPISEGYVLFRLPLSSCIKDDDPPSWLFGDEGEGDLLYNPSEWAMSLAASLLDLHLQELDNNIKKKHPVDKGMDLWLSTLPNKKDLRASLPIHWPDNILSNSKCTALEIAVDSAYFARADTIETLVSALRTRRPQLVQNMNDEKLRRLCHDALDVVQTRACRVERHVGAGLLGPPIRLLAPIFDLINHGSSRCKTLSRDGCANASFDLEIGEGDEDDREYLVVRTIRDIEANGELLLDYGESARPAWRCLASYGFVPDYRIPSEDEEADEEQDEGDTAEVYMNGVRYEVGPTNVPSEMVEGAAASLFADEIDGAQLEDNTYDEDFGAEDDEMLFST
eukprot:9566974-Ditylum_brightwellii.AAC.1